MLETPDVAERLTVLVEWSKAHLAETEVNDKIADDVREGMEKNQREFLLRQQLNAIRKELGEDEPDGAQDYRTRVEEADLPEDVRKAALREVGKLERGSDQSPEAGYLRTWLDTILELPWGTRTTDSTDVDAARAVLDADHHGLDDVKERIVEYLACAPAAPSVVWRSSAAGAPARCWRWSARPGSARPRSASRSPGRWAASSSGSPSAASATRPRSAATGAPTSARCPAGSSGPSPRPAR